MLTDIKCKKCTYGLVRSSGTVHNRRRYNCKTCAKYFSLPRPEDFLKLEQKWKATVLFHYNLSLVDISKYVDVTPQGVGKWKEKQKLFQSQFPVNKSLSIINASERKRFFEINGQLKDCLIINLKTEESFILK